MKIGDLVKRVHTSPDEIEDCAELGIGVIVGVEDPRGYAPSMPTDFIIMWPTRGLSWEFMDVLELVSEDR